MSSRRYSLPSFTSGIKFQSRRKAEPCDGHDSGLCSGDRSDDRVQEIKRMMNSVHPGHCRPLPGHLHLHQLFGNRRVDRLTCKIDCDEVYPNILIGNEASAKNRSYLRLIGVTHVLNCAEGVHYCQTNTGPEFYREFNIRYMGLSILDVPQARISIHFQEAADFMESALTTGGKVLVHCMVGLSRSATIVLAYLMIKRGLSLESAGRHIRRHREIRPNDGFIRQLIELQHAMSTSANYGVSHISDHEHVIEVLVMIWRTFNSQFEVVDNYQAVIVDMVDRARHIIRENDELTFLKIRTKKVEYIVVPDKEYTMITLLNPSAETIA